MKRLKRRISIILCLCCCLIFIFPLFACNEQNGNSNNAQDNNEEQRVAEILDELDFEFETAYTEEEHIQRIRQRTEERFADDIEKDKIKEIHVEIIYSYYTEDPEWFLVEVEYKEPFENKIFDRNRRFSPNRWYLIGTPYQTTFKHIIGRIVDDKYLEDENNSGVFIGFMDGPSVWRARGFMENKKFYNISVVAGYGIKDGSEVKSILRWPLGYVYYLSLGFLPWESSAWCTEIKTLSKEEQAEALVMSRSIWDFNFFPGTEYGTEYIIYY